MSDLPVRDSERVESFAAFIPVDRKELPTIAQRVLETTSMMKREGTYDNNSLCWSPAELERLAMFAIDAKYKLRHLTVLSDLFGFLKDHGGLTEGESRALTALVATASEVSQ